MSIQPRKKTTAKALSIDLPANDWRCRAYQSPAWHYLRKGGKRAVLLYHRRAGKDELALNWAACAAHMRVGTYWHGAPTNTQVRKIIWDAINPHTGRRRIDEIFPKELRQSTNENEMRIRFLNGSQWRCIGLDNYDSFVGDSPIGVTFSEWALCRPEAWGFIRPMLLENGGWALFIYTPRGKNHGHTMYEHARANEGWFCDRVTADKSGVFTEKQLAGELTEYIAEYGLEHGKSLFLQEYMCSFDAAIMGSVYGAWMARAENTGRILYEGVYDPIKPVHTAWDLGYDDATAIWWWQVVGNEVRLIDYYEASGQDIDHYVGVLREKREKRGFDYDRHHVPHDAANKLLAAGGRSIVARAWESGVRMTVHPATSQQNSINAARATLNHCYFDGRFCKTGIAHLKNYRFEYDQKLKTFRPRPLHDHSSHGCDAFEIIGRVWTEERKIAAVGDLQEAINKPPIYHDFIGESL